MTISIYASLLGLMFIALSVRIISLRRKLGVAVGDGNHDVLIRAMRVHANFSEYVPIVLLLNLILELMQASNYLIHANGLLLILGRLLHAFGVSNTREKLVYRVSGMTMTFTSLAISALACLYYSIIDKAI